MIDKNNKQIIDRFVKIGRKHKLNLKEMTYIELGIFLQSMDFKIDWVSLGDAHEYLGGYENEERDNKLKKEIEERHKKVFGF